MSRFGLSGITIELCIRRQASGSIQRMQNPPKLSLFAQSTWVWSVPLRKGARSEY